jgi:GT2 family glycosyltransferase
MRSLARALAPAPCDFQVVTDARSLAEGFNRILERAGGEVVILCHDDIEVLSPRLDLALQRALREFDIVGVAGAQKVSGPAVLWAGHPHVHGWVTYPRDGQLEVAPLSFHSGLAGGMQSLDGVFMAMRREAIDGLRFDERTFDGFHFYDLDFTYRAHLAGLELGVSTDVLLLHASEGRFTEDWKRYAARFLQKYPALNDPQGQPHWYGARLATREQVLAFYEMIRGLAREEDAP